MTALAMAALATGALAGPLAQPAAASTAKSARASQPGGQPVSMTLTGISPQWAGPHSTVTVHGTLTSKSDVPLSGLSVELCSSSAALTSRSELALYESGGYLVSTPACGKTWQVAGRLRPRQTVTWTASLSVRQVGMAAFGVYPLSAQTDTAAGAPIGTVQTFLPYVPARHGSGAATLPKPQQVTWIWPLIDTPVAARCHGQLARRLMSSAAGGRLHALLTAGASYSGQDKLTWAVDPALLANLETVSRCGGAQGRAAASWLASLRSALAGQNMFVTPYADVDMAALTKASLGNDLTRALTEGRSVASQVLGSNLVDPAATRVAWPAGGQATYSMLENLAVPPNDIRTLVLDSSAMPTVQALPYTAAEVSTVTDGEGSTMHVLLADHTITQVLGTVDAKGATAGTAVAAEQRYLAETAMIAAWEPASGVIVVAPPRRWAPSSSMADTVLRDTASAPWLRPTSMASLVRAKKLPGQVARHSPNAMAPGALSRSLLSAVKAQDQRIRELQSILVKPDQALSLAIAAIESSMWRGGRTNEAGALKLLHQLAGTVTRQTRSVYVVGDGHVTLGGLKGNVQVLIDNQLNRAVRVKVAVTPQGNNVTVSYDRGLITVPANTQKPVAVKFQAGTIGTTVVKLSLLTPTGRLVSPPVKMTVEATQLGNLALIILAGALGIFMIASAARAMRRGQPGATASEPDPSTGAGDGGGSGQAAQTDTVDAVDAQPGAADAGDVVTEESDDYARARVRPDSG
jgi:hypothetical protein